MGRLITAGTRFEWYRNVRIPPDSLSRRSCNAAQAEAATAAGAAAADGGGSRSGSRDRVPFDVEEPMAGRAPTGDVE